MKRGEKLSLRAKRSNLKFIIIALMLLTSCGKQEAPLPVAVVTQKPLTPAVAGDELIYLKVENAVASSFDETPDWAPEPNPMAPVDRDMLTRWSPRLGEDDQWIYFDFGKPKILTKIVIKWEQAYAPKYKILVSPDAVEWKQLALMSEQDGGTDEIKFSPEAARYVKIVGLERVNPDWGFSMWEFEIYGPKELNPDEKVDTSAAKDIKAKKAGLEKELAALKKNPGKLTLEEFHKGVVYTSWTDSELGSVASDLSLVHLAKLGVGHVAIMVPAYQNTIDSEIIVTHDRPGGDTPTDEAIKHAIKTCHSLGMKVMLKPHVDCIDGTPRIDILGSEKWFVNYKEMILRYARLAAENNAEMYCIGTELENTTFSRWDAEWRDVFAAVKEVYKGHIIYAANWTEYEEVPFWDLVDFIGIDAYFPLTDKNDPTVEELAAAWETSADKIETWLNAKALTQPVIFTELGYVSSDGTNKQPWATLNNSEDQQEQADALSAALEVLTKRSWFKGIYWWQYFPQDRWSPLGFTIKNKLAEKELEKWYKGIEG